MTNAPQNPLLTKAAGSVKWSALMELVSRTAQPIIFVALATLLTPADYGIVATASIAITFSQMFWDAGLGKALIQTKESPEDAADVVFWTNVALGLVLYICLFEGASWIAQFFKSPESGPVLRVLAAQIIIASFTSVQQAIFVRDFNFKSLFWIRLATAFSPGLISIPLAFFGYGVWALVAGSLTGQVINLVLLWNRSRWRPRFRYNMEVARRLFPFGFWVVLESVGAWLITWGDNLIVGRYLGVHDLGLYRTGSMLVTVIFGLVLNPVLPILFPAFSRLQDDRSALTSMFHKVNQIIIAIAIPMGLGLLLAGREITGALFSSKWEGLGFVVGVIGLMQGTAWLVGLNAELYRAMGRPDVNTKLMYAQLFYYLPAFYVSSHYGLVAFVWTRFFVALVATPIHIYLCVRMLRVSPSYLWQEGKHFFLAAGFMLLAINSAKGLLGYAQPHPWIPLIILLSAGAFSYFAIVWIFNRAFLLHTKNIVLRVVSL
jgi:O-antigen/teichoic acid export membrane protein